MRARAQQEEPEVPTSAIQEIQALPVQTMDAVENPYLIRMLEKAGEDTTGKTDDEILSAVEEHTEQIGVREVVRDPVTKTLPSEVVAAQALAEYTLVYSQTLALTGKYSVQPAVVYSGTSTTDDQNRSLYLPLVVQAIQVTPTEPVTVHLQISAQRMAEIRDDINALAQAMVRPHGTNIPETKLCPGETAGIPGWYLRSNNVLAMLGESDATSGIDSYIVGRDFFHATTIWPFSDGGRMVVWYDMIFNADKTITYEVSIREFTGTDRNLDVGFGNYWVVQDVGTVSLPQTRSLDRTQPFPTIRSALRHACEMLAMRAPKQLGRALNDNYIEAYNAQFTLILSGFTRTIAVWAPVSGLILPAYDAMFWTEAFSECNRDLSQMRGLNGISFPQYPYISKVCVAVLLYIGAYQIDPLGLEHYAKNVINITKNPDTVIPWPGPTPGDTTPRLILKYVDENYWTGYGVRKLTGPNDVSSAIRTFAHNSLANGLCLYGDPLGCEVVGRISGLLEDLVVGDDCLIDTEDHGEIFRCYPGAIPPLYRAQQVVGAEAGQIQLAVPDRGTFDELMDDWFGMPQEIWDDPTFTHEGEHSGEESIGESLSLVGWTGVAGMPWIPSDGKIEMRSDEAWIDVPAYTPMVLGDVMRITGARRVCIKKRGELDCDEHSPVYPDMGLIVYGASRPLTYSGTAVAEDDETSCDVGPGGSICGFPTRPYPYNMLLASNIRSIGAAQGGQNIRVVWKDPSDGSLVTYPGEDFQITKETAYEVISDNQFTLRFGPPAFMVQFVQASTR